MCWVVVGLLGVKFTVGVYHAVPRLCRDCASRRAGLMYCAYVILGELSTYVLKMCYDYLVYVCIFEVI